MAGGAAAYLQARQRSQDTTAERVLAVARSVAASPLVRSEVTAPDANPSAVLQPYAEQVRRDTGVDFVVVMTTKGIRYSHPKPELIGKTFSGHIDAAVAGGVVLETYGGSFGPSERVVVPVRAGGGPVLALVSVGVTRANISRELSQQVPMLVAAGIVALLLAAAGSALIARRLGRLTHGLAPDELASMYEFYDAVLHAVREGLVLLDLDGRLLLANDEAVRLLDLPADWAGRRLDELGLPAPMTEALEGSREVDDAIHLTSSRVLVVNQAAARWEGRELGTVLTLRDHTDLQALTGELDSARGLADTLRSQAHEAANRLHSVISLIELGRTDQALTFATAELALAQQLTDLVVGAVDEPVLAALLLGKAAEANERGVELEVDPESAVPEGVIPARDLVTMVGNLLDNAIDAAAAAPGPRRVGFSSWLEDSRSASGISSDLVLQVSDSGAGLDTASAARAFTRGWSTKTDGRLLGHGLGLALVGQAAHRHHGTVDVSHVGNPVYGRVASGASASAAAAAGTSVFVGAVFTIRLPLAVESVAP
ncbi:MAG: PAS domain-containing protein [Phycicoccus sp.]|nr:PAS domain-containing protein [Phycicoccus sp.]NMM35086.1 PAS domain-containing protein [Phycicoccus sp.]